MNREKELADLIWNILICDNKMFYGFFLSELNKEFTKSIETAAVGRHVASSNISLLINPEFWDKVGQDEKVKGNNQREFLLFHELSHVIYEHVQGGWDWLVKDKMLGNIAMDLFINQTLNIPDMPDGGMLPSTFPNLNLLPNEGTEYYYRELEKAKEKKKQSADRGEPNSDGEPKKGTSGDGTFDRMVERGEDIHKTWEEITKGMSDGEKKLLEKQISSALREAVDQTEKARGTIPVHLKDLLKSRLTIKTPVANWRAVLRQFAGNSQKVENYRTRKRENYRCPDSPANKTKVVPSICVGIDTSGSVGEHELHEFFNEIYHIWKTGVSVTLVHWDTQVHLVEDYKGQKEVKRVVLEEHICHPLLII